MFRTRGLNGVVLLSNGIRDERSEFYSCAPTSSFVGVNRIEVLKGPSSAMIGHSAIGGIINIFTTSRRQQPQWMQGSLSAVGIRIPLS